MQGTNSFIFKHFRIIQKQSAFKVGTDGVLLGAWVNSSNPRHILDIGTGTGLIALMLAQRFKSRIYAIEKHIQSYDEALKNFENSNWYDRILAQNIEIQNFNPNIQFDLIVSNPPFFSNSLKTNFNSKTDARHNDSLPITVLIEFALNHLTNNGLLAVIYPVKEGLECIRQGIKSGFYAARICRVRPTPSKPTHRLLIELSKKRQQIKKEEIYIEKARHVYSDSYIEITKDFYLNM